MRNRHARQSQIGQQPHSSELPRTLGIRRAVQHRNQIAAAIAQAHDASTPARAYSQQTHEPGLSIVPALASRPVDSLTLAPAFGIRGGPAGPMPAQTFMPAPVEAPQSSYPPPTTTSVSYGPDVVREMPTPITDFRTPFSSSPEPSPAFPVLG